MALKTERDPVLPTLPQKDEFQDFDRLQRWWRSLLSAVKNLHQTTYDDLVGIISTGDIDLPLYAKLAGRPGGQTLAGGTGVNESLVLEGTSNINKDGSKVILQPSAGNVGIGIADPEAKFHIAGGSARFDRHSDPQYGQYPIWICQYDMNAPVGIGFNTWGWGPKVGILYERTDSYDRGNLYFVLNNDESGDPATKSDARMVLLPNGNVGIGTTDPTYQLQLSQDSAAKPSTNTWTVVSDERLKEDIQLANLDRCYEIVKNLPLKRFTWKEEVFTIEQVKDRSKLGWISSDVEQFFPKSVGRTKFRGLEDCLDLNADQIYAVLYGAVQKLIQKVEELEAKYGN